MGGRCGCGSSGDPDQAFEDEAKNRVLIKSIGSRIQVQGFYRRHRRSIRARRSIIVRHRTYLCCSSHSSQSEEKKIELVLGPHSDSTSLFFNGTHRICRIETYSPFASATSI